jgi:hypothetical protein
LDEAFLAACSNGYFDIAQWLYGLEDEDEDLYVDALESAFIAACSNGHFVISQWLFVGVVDASAAATALIGACTAGHVAIVKWMWDMGVPWSKQTLDAAFLGACTNGHMDILRLWFKAEAACDPEGFVLACRNGHVQVGQRLLVSADPHSIDRCMWDSSRFVEVLQWLCALDPSRIVRFAGGIMSVACMDDLLDVAMWVHKTQADFDRDEAFSDACYCKKGRVAKWIHGLGGVDVSVASDDCFLHMCYEGHLDMAVWIYSFGAVSDWGLGDGFELACRHGHLAIAQFLYNHSGIDIHQQYEYVFRETCRKGHLHIARWLYGLGGVDVHVNCGEPFRRACKHGYVHIAKWLYHAIGGVTAAHLHSLDNEAFLRLCKDSNLRAARWLVSLDPDGPWPTENGLETLQVLGLFREAWMCAVARAPRKPGPLFDA